MAFWGALGIIIGLIIIIMMNPATLAGVNTANSTANITYYPFFQETINSIPFWGFLIVAVMVFGLIMRYRRR